MKLDINKTKEFIIFLLKRIESYKKDWNINNDEIQQFKNELDNFKQQIISTHLVSDKIKERILKIELNFKLKVSNSKRYFWQILDSEGDSNSLTQLERKDEFERIETDLQNTLRLLQLEE